MDFDIQNLNRELDRTKSSVFLKGNSAFLGSLMCSMEFRWMPEIETAQTDGTYVGWNPHFFMSLSPKTRTTVLVHELWHPARLHNFRMGSRDPEIWNWACDIRINNDLLKEGYSFVGIEWGWREPEIDQTAAGILSEEDIYDILIERGEKPPPQPDNGDLKPASKDTINNTIGSVLRAIHEATLAGEAGSIPGSVTSTIKKFLEPVIPWEATLMRFMTELLDSSYTWRRPSRRSQEVYLPSTYLDDGRLEHLAYYLDVSGSCSDADVLRFNSEVKYIKEVMQPEKLTLVQFDTVIQQVREFGEYDPFDEIVIVGRGGTSLECVRQHMESIKPTAAIVFSDLQCPPMGPLTFDIPTIWVAIRAAGMTVPFGELIHIRK